MNGYYVGLLSWPLSIAGLAIAVGAVMWALHRMRIWSEGSTARLNHPIQLPKVHELSRGNRISTAANLNKRDVLVDLVATSRRAKLVQFTANSGLIIVSGGGTFSPEETKVFRDAFNAAVQELGEAQSIKEQGLDDENESDVPVKSETVEAPEKAAEAS